MLIAIAQTLALHLFFPRTMAPTPARDPVIAGPPELHHALSPLDRPVRFLRRRQDP